MGKGHDFDFGHAQPQPERSANGRSREEVLRDVKLAIAQNSNYGREHRAQGSNPYDSRLGKPQRYIWGSHKRPS
jgi:hypothetical protein